MGEEQYLSRIRQLESEIEYLHGLLDNAGILYKREAKEIEDFNKFSWEILLSFRKYHA